MLRLYAHILLKLFIVAINWKFFIRFHPSAVYDCVGVERDACVTAHQAKSESRVLHALMYNLTLHKTITNLFSSPIFLGGRANVTHKQP